MELSPKVRSAIEKHFAEGERAEVARLLADYGEGTTSEGAERIHLTILRISRRDVNRVRTLVDIAKDDHRDVIMAESHPSRTYFVGLLRRTPGDLGGFAHLSSESLEAWKKAGAIVVGGMCLDDSDLLGVYIFTVDSVEEARATVSTDPAIESGRLYFEFHPWLTADGLQVGVPKDFLEV